MKESYEINSNTLAIMPIDEKNSKVYEINENFIVNKSVSFIINSSCKFFGSSYSGRCEGTKGLLGMSYKLPIIIEETNEIIFFPTSSPRFNNCCWISLKHVDNYTKNNNKVNVTFKNLQTIEFDLSINSFENQIFRALRLENILKKRKLAI